MYAWPVDVSIGPIDVGVSFEVFARNKQERKHVLDHLAYNLAEEYGYGHPFRDLSIAQVRKKVKFFITEEEKRKVKRKHPGFRIV